MKITLNKKWRIGGWEQILGAAVGSAAGAVMESGEKAMTPAYGEDRVGASQPNFMKLLQQNSGQGKSFDSLQQGITNLGRQDRPDSVQQGSWLRLLTGGL